MNTEFIIESMQGEATHTVSRSYVRRLFVATLIETLESMLSREQAAHALLAYVSGSVADDAEAALDGVGEMVDLNQESLQDVLNALKMWMGHE